jgi:L-ribulose-5-phosphate 3-epimerase
MMRIGVRAHDFGKLPAEILAGRIAAKGLSCVQLALSKAIAGIDLKPGELNPGMAFHVGQAFHRHGLQIAVLGCYINPIHPDRETRRVLLGLFKEHLRFARDFGCSLVALETGSVNADYSFHPDNHGEPAFQMFLASIAALVEEAEKFGVIVGIEGVATHVVSTPVRMRTVLDTIGSNHLQVVLDPVNLLTADNYQGQDRLMKEAFDLYSDRIVVIHAKDFIIEDRTFKAVRAGQGCLNYELLLGMIQQRKPYVSVLLEEAGEDTVEECLRFLHNAASAAHEHSAVKL